MLPGGLGCLLFLFLFLHQAGAAEPASAARLLQEADQIKTADPVRFEAILKSLESAPEKLAAPDQEFLRYLQGWKSAYDGDYPSGMTRLKALVKNAQDVNLRFRAHLTIVNMLDFQGEYERAFIQLSDLLDLLPRTSDRAAREQAFVVASQLYEKAGQYDLSLRYAQTLIDENWAGRGICKGGQLKMAALYASAALHAADADLQSAIDTCEKVGERGYANFIRTYAARMYLKQDRVDEAIDLLTRTHREVEGTHYGRLISEYDALLAEAYRRKHHPVLARQFAGSAIAASVKDGFIKPLIDAYRVRYQLAKDQGDFKSALTFHEKLTAADKGYLDELSVRQLAFQRASHESLSTRLQIDALNKQNHVLELQKQLNEKAVETSRLYIALLALTLVFIGLWAYRTKRLQLHFMSLSQLDGLTGICNRPHFIAMAEQALEYARKTRQDVCILLCDLDHFKAINDRHGHATGDFVLKRMVSACKLHLRKSDIFGRFGGEEFAILLPGCHVQEARLRSEQLRQTISGITTHHGSVRASVSASFGVATTATSGYELRELLAHADAALYQAKRTGRNRVVLYDAMDEFAGLEAAFDERITLPGRSSTMY